MNQAEMILATLEEIKDLLHGKTKKLMSIKDVADYTGYAPITIRRAHISRQAES